METNQDLKINWDTGINREREMKQDKEAQHHTKYIIKPLVQENNYILKYINYMPTYFINSW